MIPASDAAAAEAAVTARAAVRAIRVPYRPQEELRYAMAELAESAARSRRRPQSGFQLLAESHSGKSTILEAVAREFNEDPSLAPGEIPVPYVRIDVDSNLGSVATDILRGMGERFPHAGRPPARWQRVEDSIKERNVKVLAFDEFQRAGKGVSVSTQIGGKIQTLLDKGLCAAAFVGEPSATALFKRVPALQNRMDAPIQLPELLWHDEGDRKLFTDFSDGFDRALVAAGVTDCMSGLALADTAERMLEASRGRIGLFCRIVENAAMQVARDGRSVIDVDDLACAVDEWAIGNGHVDRNPFL